MVALAWAACQLPGGTTIYPVTSGQSPWGATGSLDEAVDVAIFHRADYLFVWQEDIANPAPDVQRTLDYAASNIGRGQ